MKNASIVFLAALLLAFSPLPSPVSTVAADDDPFAWKWYELDERGDLQLNLFLFYRSTCPHCADAKAFLDRFRQQHPWLHVARYETSHAGNLELYRRMSQSLGRVAGQVPAIFYCKQMTMGYDSDARTGRQIETRLVYCHEQLLQQLKEKRPASGDGAARQYDSASVGLATFAGAGVPLTLVAWAPDDESNTTPQPSLDSPAPDAPAPDEPAPDVDRAETTGPQSDMPELEMPDLDELELELPPPLPEEKETVALPLFGEYRVDDMSLPALTVVIAGCDAFNPCAFFILLSLLSLLIHAHSRLRMLLVGGIFVFFSGLFYFLFMSAWLNVFLLAGHLPAITITAGLLAMLVAVINIKDYFLMKRGVSLSIPDSAKPGLFARMRKLPEATRLAPMLVGTLALALAANTYELLCTAGFPMVFTRALTLRELPTSSYYGYLVFYNLIYIVPLAVIVLGFTITLGSHKLQDYEGRVLKLLSGVMMLLLGGVILFAPDLLQSLLASLGVLLGAVGVTALVVLLDWLQKHFTHHSEPKTHLPARKRRSVGKA
ncbi:MAG: hypothetical protein RIC55_22070 [Pirellulaceae bacterium]